MKGSENSGQRKKQAAEFSEGKRAAKFSEKNGQRKAAKFSEKKQAAKKQRKAAEFSEKKTGSGILKSDVKEDGSSKGIDYSHPC